MFYEKGKRRLRANCLIKAVCVWCGVSDLQTIGSQEGKNNGIDKCIESLLGGSALTLHSHAVQASPVCSIKMHQFIPPFS